FVGRHGSPATCLDAGMTSCHEEASVEKLSALVCWRWAPQFRPIGAKKARDPIQSAPPCKRSVNICARARRWLAARPFVLAIAAGRQCRLQIAIAATSIGRAMAGGTLAGRL